MCAHPCRLQATAGGAPADQTARQGAVAATDGLLHNRQLPRSMLSPLLQFLVTTFLELGRGTDGKTLEGANDAYCLPTIDGYLLQHAVGEQRRRSADRIYPIGANSLSLNNADFSLLIDAANGLLRKSPLRIGASTSWRNQQTGSNGTIHVTKTFHRDGMLCHTLSYETIPAATPPANTTMLNWCKTPDNQWKILS